MRRIQFTPVDSEENAGEKGAKDCGWPLGDGNVPQLIINLKTQWTEFCQEAKRLRKLILFESLQKEMKAF